MKVYFDNALRLSCTHDFVATVFAGQNKMYWGATAATGGLNNQQYFCPQTVVILGASLQQFDVTCHSTTIVQNLTDGKH